MSERSNSPAFPTIYLHDFLIPWDRCLGVKLGPIDPMVVQLLEERDYDFAPVFQPVKYGEAVLGLISRERLRELMVKDFDLRADDRSICRSEVYDRPSLGVLLDTIASNPAAIVIVDQAEYGSSPLGLITRSDLNKHPFRAVLYSLLADLETGLATLVHDSFSDPWEWISRLNEEKQARVLGYWELSKRRGVDIGPVGAITLAELLTVVACAEKLRSMLDYTSRKAFEKDVGRIPDLRNQIMHPVRPLISDTESITGLKKDVGIIILVEDHDIVDTLLPEKSGFLCPRCIGP